jgi:hypothetical protein
MSDPKPKLTVTRPNAVALLARDQASIAANAEALRRKCEEEPDEQDACNCHPEERTGGVHDPNCPEWQPECTCYEVIGGHQPGCYFHARKRAEGKSGE